ncbi:unnamed protein product [Lactuca saligna]|uniref:Uncharacterized protein n=1 Tax=Lactuca saligna TaxID=75948 RepID=A0AA35ZRV4_LACSI|nr:unnamed protein product [Lactuca saligna]
MVKFGKFAETEDVQTSSAQTSVVAKEHAVPSRPNLSSSFEVSEDDDDDDDDDESDSDNDGIDFRMFVPSKESVNEVVISPAETKEEINIFKQQNNPTPKHMEALIDKLQSTTRKPPKAVYITFGYPSGSDKDNSKASLLPQKQGGDEDSHQNVSELKQEIVFFKQESIEKDILIGILDVRVSNLEQENSVKDAKISELQANLGGLTAIFI